MKNKLFLFFVVMVTTLSNNVYSSNVEVHSKVIDQRRVKGNLIRFTLEVQSDSSLCPEFKNVRECYVVSKTLKKYVYMDITKTPYITDQDALSCFSNIGLIPLSNGGWGTSVPLDFKKITPIEKINGFPWVTITTTKTSYFFYRLNRKTNQTEAISVPYTSNEWNSPVVLFWIILICSIFLRSVEEFENTKISFYVSGVSLEILFAYNGQYILFFVFLFSFFLVISLLGKLNGTRCNQTNEDYEESFYYRCFRFSLVTCIFYFADQYVLVYLNLCIFILSILYPLLPYKLRYSIENYIVNALNNISNSFKFLFQLFYLKKQ
ncbi:MAG: hypothetical protein RL687_275 [Candidatus Parcubacteria bacterium]|jgi:hypothetical protein